MDNVCICLIHEDAYSRELFQSLVEKSESKMILLTFGSQFSINETKCHFRKLDQVLPSVLFDTLANAIPSLRSSSRVMDSSASPCFRHKRTRRYSNPVQSTKDSDKIKKLKNLIAEDNKINQRVLCRILERMSIKNVDIANDGKQAVDLEQINSYDLILMDMQMPNMDGVEATKRILQSYDNNNNLDEDSKNMIPKVTSSNITTTTIQGPRSVPKIVFVTAHAEPCYEQECLNAGAIAFITKPYSVHDIETLIHRLFVEKQQK